MDPTDLSLCYNFRLGTLPKAFSKSICTISTCFSASNDLVQSQKDANSTVLVYPLWENACWLAGIIACLSRSALNCLFKRPGENWSDADRSIIFERKSFFGTGITKECFQLVDTSPIIKDKLKMKCKGEAMWETIFLMKIRGIRSGVSEKEAGHLEIKCTFQRVMG